MAAQRKYHPRLPSQCNNSVVVGIVVVCCCCCAVVAAELVLLLLLLVVLCFSFFAVGVVGAGIVDIAVAVVVMYPC